MVPFIMSRVLSSPTPRIASRSHKPLSAAEMRLKTRTSRCRPSVFSFGLCLPELFGLLDCILSEPPLSDL